MSATLRLRRLLRATRGGRTACAAEARPAAPHAPRLAAWLLDFVLVMVVAAGTSEPFPLAIPIALFVAYHALAVWLTGQTIGKTVFGLRVVRVAGARTFAWSLGRASIGYLGCSLVGLGLLLALRDQRHRALHDVPFGSNVVVIDDGRFSLKTVLARLGDFARMREEESTKRHAAIGVSVLGVLWGWLRSIADGVVGALDWLSGLGGASGSGSGPSPLGALGTKAKSALAVVATAVSSATVAFAPPVADAIEWVFQPRYYFAAPSTARAGTFATPEDAIRAFARNERWRDRGWNYEGDCADATRGQPRRLVCSTAWHGTSAWVERRLEPGERAYFVAPGWSDVHYAALALERQGGGWVVTHELEEVESP